MPRFDEVSSTHKSLFHDTHGLRSAENHPAWEAFYRKYQPCIRDFCLYVFHLDPDAAEEVTQRIVVKLLEKMKDFQYDPTKSFRSWLKMVVRHAAVDFYRERDRTTAIAENTDKSHDLFDSITEDHLVEVLDDHWVMEYCRDLYAKVAPEIQATANARHWQAWEMLQHNQTPREVARKLDMKTANVYQVRKRINDEHRQAIKRMIDRNGLAM